MFGIGQIHTCNFLKSFKFIGIIRLNKTVIMAEIPDLDNTLNLISIYFTVFLSQIDQ